jgi:hypothetical protein
LGICQSEECGEVERPGCCEDPTIRHADGRLQEFTHQRAGMVGQLKSDAIALTPGVDDLLHLGQQVGCLVLLQFQVGIACNPERDAFFNRFAWKEPGEKHTNDIFEQNVAESAVGRDGDEPLARTTERDDRETG